MLPRSQLSITIFVTLIIILAAILLRFIHLDADTPNGLSWSAGLYVDEGYKTLSPRNLYLFGDTHWHSADTYAGWMSYSPLTQWPVYAAFKTFGQDITSARLVPILYFTLFLLLYALIFWRKYPPTLFFLGLVLLATDATLFTFSRVALFEIPLTFFLYCLIFPLALLDDNRQKTLIPVAWIMAGGIAIAFLIKQSAFVYIACIIAPVFILFILNRYHLSKKNVALLFITFIIITVTLLVITYNTWIGRIGITPFSYIYAVIENPLLVTSPLLILAGTACAAHAIVYKPELYLKNTYRFSLVFMVIITPFILSAFPYNPLRYYTPIVPAYILLIIEWFSTTKSFKVDKQQTGNIKPAVGLFLLSLIILFLFTAIGLHESIKVRYLILISVATVFIIWYFRRTTFSLIIVKNIITVLVALSIIQNLYFITSFVSNPTYDARTMRKRMSEIVENDEVIAGGWAPFLALGTPIKTIYANTDFNSPSALKIIKPDYFILSETPTALKTFDLIKKDKDITTGNPIQLGTYNTTNVRIYPLSYK